MKETSIRRRAKGLLMAGFRVLFALAILPPSTVAEAETWKMVTTRQADGAPINIDTDYLLQHGDLIEFRVRYKSEKTVLTLLLPPGETEEHYVVNCTTKQYGLTYLKVTNAVGSKVERDALPSAVIMAAIPGGSMLDHAATWVCTEQKTRVAARPATYAGSAIAPSSAATGGSKPPLKDLVPDDALRRFNWKPMGSRIPVGGTADETFDAYVAENAMVDGEDGIRLFLQRWDYHKKDAANEPPSKYEIGYWAVGCSTHKLLMLEVISLDARGAMLQRQKATEGATPFEPKDGSIGATIFAYTCNTSAATNAPPQAEPKAAKGISVGTAWLSDRGYFVTAYHVIDGHNDIAIRSVDGRVSAATIVSIDKPNDIAILNASVAPANVGLTIAKGLPGLGARVFTIGYPHPDLMGTSQKLTSGDISSLAGLNDDPRLLQISTPVQAGNSGGPLINMNGEVVGLVSAKLSAPEVFSKTGDLPQNVNYAIKARYIAGMLEDLPPQSTQASPRPLKQQSLEDLASNAKRSIFFILAQ